MKDFILIMPEIFLALTLVFAVLGEVTHHGEKIRLVAFTTLVGLAGALVQTLIAYRFEPAQAFGHALSVDGFTLFFRLLFISTAILAVITALLTQEIPADSRSEYCVLIVASALAMCISASSADLLLSFMALQFMNILGYFLAGYGKRSISSTEAAVKYMIFGIVSGALLLYGFAILFASTHTLNIYDIHKALVATPLPRSVMLITFVLVFLSFSFQFGAFPMYLWAPDVLEGAPTPASAFISLASRCAGFAVALRFLTIVFSQPALSQGQWQILGEVDWAQIVALISGLTMLVGSLLAYRQVGAKRMVGCLVVVQSGFLLMGLLVLDSVGTAALLYNLVTELFSLIGIFYVISFFMDELGSDRLVDFRGMLARAVPECICLLLFLIGLVGLPPMPGFIGKFTLIGTAIQHGWLGLAVIAIISMALTAVTVTRLAYNLIGDFQKAATPPVFPSLWRKAFLGTLLVPMVLAGIFAEFILDWAGKSVGFILW